MAHENPSERGKRHLREAGYKHAAGGNIHDDEAADERLIRRKVKASALKRKCGGAVHGGEPESRPDRRAAAAG